VDEAANVRTVYKRAFRDLVFEAIKGLEVNIPISMVSDSLGHGKPPIFTKIKPRL
jgi:tartrate dehydratase beta subunit/fumarate hydratase class I family protein